MPRVGVLLVHGDRDQLVVMDGDRLCRGPLASQEAADRGRLVCRPLRSGEPAELASAVEAAWRYHGPQRPGAGMIFLVDRSLCRRLVFGAHPPGALGQLIGLIV